MRLAAAVAALLIATTAIAAPVETALYPYTIQRTIHIPTPHKLVRIGLRAGVPTIWAQHAPGARRTKAVHFQWYKENQRLTLEDSTHPNRGTKRLYLGAVAGRFYYLAYEAEQVQWPE